MIIHENNKSNKIIRIESISTKILIRNFNYLKSHKIILITK